MDIYGGSVTRMRILLLPWETGKYDLCEQRENLVVSIAALFTPKAKDRIGLIKEYIEPVFDTGSL